MKVTALQTNFTAGELSPRLHGRVDITKYRNGAATLENFLVSPYGGARKRGGTKYVATCIQGAFASRLIRFVYNNEQAYIVEIGASFIRFHRDKGVLTETALPVTGLSKANPAVLTSVAHGLSNDDYVLITSVGGMTEANNRIVKIGGVAANTMNLVGINSTGWTTYTSGGSVARVVQIASPYASDEIDDIKYTQSNDVLYLAHPNHPLKRLNRLTSTSFEIVNADIVGGPFRPINTDRFNKLDAAQYGSAINMSNATQANPVVITTATDHGLNDGDSITCAVSAGMTQLNGNKYVARNVTTNTLELWDYDETTIDGTAFTAYAAGTNTVTRSTSVFSTFSEGSTEVRLIADKDTFTSDMVGMLVRVWEPGQSTGAPVPNVTSATLQVGGNYTNEGKVYGLLRMNGTIAWHDTFTMPKHEAGTVRTYRSDNPGIYLDFVYLHSLYCVLEITTYVNATQVRATVKKGHVPRSVILFGSSYWELGAWNEHYGYPHIVTLHEQRLWAGATETDGRYVWGSRIPSFLDFSDGAQDDDAVSYQLASNGADKISWLVPTNVLAIGTTAGEFVAAPSQRNEALTPSNVRMSRQTPYGAADVDPVQVGAAVIYAERDGKPSNPARKLREFLYAFDSDSYRSNDLTILAEHISETGFYELAYQQAPDSIVWARRGDGRLGSMVYEPSQEVVGWMRQTLGGEGDSGGGIAQIKRIACIPGSSGDDLYMVVQRYINGATVHTLEVLEQPLKSTDGKGAMYYMDCGATYVGAATDTITGLNWLEGESVTVTVDGATHPQCLVSGGTITLNTTGERISIGYGYVATLETLDLEAGAQAGTAQSRKRRISRCYVKLNKSLGGRIGRGAHYETITVRTAADPQNASPPLYTGYKAVDFPAGWDEECVVKVIQSQPLPMEVLAIIPEIDTQG